MSTTINVRPLNLRNDGQGNYLAEVDIDWTTVVGYQVDNPTVLDDDQASATLVTITSTFYKDKGST